MPLEEIDALLSEAIDPQEFSKARAVLEEVRAPAARRRSILRNPNKYLADILRGWHSP